MPTYLSPGVYVEEVEAGSRPIEGVGTAVAAFVGFADRGPFDEPTLVTNWTQFTETFGDFVEGFYLAHAVYGYFQNGGGTCYVVRVGDAEARGETKKPVTATSRATLGAYAVSALATGTSNGRRDRRGPRPGRRDRPARRLRPHRQEREQGRGDLRPGHHARGKDNVVTVVNERSKLIPIEETTTGATLTRPDAATVTLEPSAPTTAAPAAADPDDYLGDVADRTGFGGLEAVDEITMVAVPDLMSAYQQGALDREAVLAVQNGLISHCELMGDRVAIIDPLPDLKPQQVRTWRVDEARFDSKYAALYYPWVKVWDPATSATVLVPPSGHMAGIWARNDETRGVHKAPANEVIRGPVSLATQITKAEHDLLNPLGVNCLRAFPGRGLRVWGARTLCRPTRRGATSTSGGCSTTSRSRSSTAPSGWSSSRTTTPCGHGSGARSPRSSSTSGARVRCSVSRPTRRST